jgi:hypothetical protein
MNILPLLLTTSSLRHRHQTQKIATKTRTTKNTKRQSKQTVVSRFRNYEAQILNKHVPYVQRRHGSFPLL